MIAWLRILRPLNLFQATLAVLLGMAILGTLGQTRELLLLIFSVVFINGAGNVINDIRDLEIDRINRPARPLPAGAIQPRAAAWYTGTLFAGGLLLAAFLNWSSFLIAACIAFPLLTGYSFYFKRMVLVGNLVVAVMLGMAFIYVGAAMGRIADMIPIALLAFGFTIIREIVKDLEDMEGDRAVDARTLPLVWGVKKTLVLTLVLILLFSLLDLLPSCTGLYDQDYFWTVLVGVNLPLWAVAIWLWQRPERRTFARVQLFLKLDIFIGLAAVMLGATS